LSSALASALLLSRNWFCAPAAPLALSPLLSVAVVVVVALKFGGCSELLVASLVRLVFPFIHLDL